MDQIENLTVALPSDIASALKAAVEAGEYASTDEAVGAALRDWTRERGRKRSDLEGLKADIDEGLADVVVGRVRDFDVRRIAERGRTILKSRSTSG